MIHWLRGTHLAACAYLVFAFVGVACDGAGKDCSECSSDDDCESGFCHKFSFGHRCVGNASGESTECCVGIHCEIYYGSGRPGHGCLGTAPTTCAACEEESLNGCRECVGCESVGTCSGELEFDDCASCAKAIWVVSPRGCGLCPGCETGPAACTGSCWDIHSQERCESVGCTWDDADADCSGTAQTICDSFVDEDSCRATSNAGACLWSECGGTLSPCSELSSDSSACNDQDGCTWSTTCTGQPIPCDQLSSEECQAQTGCFYQ